MGKTLLNLSQKKIGKLSVFPHRFVIEICERVHTHYKNLRLVQSMHDFLRTAEGFKNAIERWEKMGCPGTGPKHIELCRKRIEDETESETIEINLNENLYLKNEGKIYSEGAEIADPHYIHLKIRDARVELTVKDFEELHNAITEAKRKIEDSSFSSLLSEA